MRRASAAGRAGRLLAVLPRLAAGARLDLGEVAASLGASAAELAADLVTLSMCGVPPYTPDVLVAVFLEGDEVVSWADPPALDGPVRLSADEAQTLVTALEAAGRGPDHPLTVKLLDAAGPAGDAEDLRARVLAPGGEPLGVAAAALDRCETVRIRYLTGATGEMSSRVVHPYSLDDHAGVWYLTAYCETARDVRVFRMDRVAGAEATGAGFVPPENAPVFDPDPFERDGLPEAVIRFEPGEAVDPHDWPSSTIQEADDGATLVTVPYARPGWVARRVVARLGAARVLSPPELQETASAMANTLLEALD